MVGLLISEICDAISHISVSGVTVKDVNEISPSWIGTPNVLYPNPNQDAFITNFAIQYDSVLMGAESPMRISYTLNYRFLGSLIGDLGTFSSAYADVVSKLTLITNTIIATPSPYSGRVMMTLSSMTIGARADPAGNMFHGADFSLAIEELQN